MKVLPLLLVLACGSGAQPSPVLTSAVAPSRSMRSCALETPRRSPAKLALSQWLGRAGDRSWVIVSRDERFALATLGDDGTLVVTPLPVNAMDDMMQTAFDGTRLWLVVGKPGLDTGEEALYEVVLDTATPQVRRVEELAAKTIAGANSFAIGATRALFFTHAAGAGFQLWDRTRHAPLLTEKHPPIALDPPQPRCTATRCFATSVIGDGPSRRLTSFRFSDDKLEREQLADDHLGTYLLVPTGEQNLVLWTSYSRRGLFARALDAEGRPITGEVQLVQGRAADPQWVRSPAGVFAAYRNDDDWVLAELAPDHRSVARTNALGIPKASFLTVANATDGTLAVGFSTSHSFHGEDVPPTTAHAVFVATGDAPDAPIDVLGKTSLYDYTAFPLVAPGHAAVLVLPQGDRHGDRPGELVMLRTPCR